MMGAQANTRRRRGTMRRGPTKHAMQPTRTQIEAAAAAAAEAYGAEQVILFGSQARGDAGPQSDVDLLVLTPGDGSAPDARRSSIQRLDEDSEIGRKAGGTPVHILRMSKPDAEDARCRPARVGGAALEEGVTVYAEPLTAPVKTGARYWILPGNKVVKKTQFEPAEAEQFITSAEEDLEDARLDQGRRPEKQCVRLQSAMEYALKGLLTAKGGRVPHTHNLNRLWDDTESAGVRITAPRDRTALDELTQYGRNLGYSAPPVERPARETVEKTKDTVKSTVTQAREQLPGIIRETEEKLKTAARMAVGTTDPSPDRALDGLARTR